jgi:acylphosphatase
VHGVGYRGSLTLEAKRLGVNGWVRNRLDGSVEAEVSGAIGAVEAVIEWAQRGPCPARVASVEVTASAEIHAGFEQRDTG